MSRYDAKFLHFALHCRVLLDPLLELVDQQGEKRKTPRKPWLGVSPADDNGQYLLFPLPIKNREEYGSFAKTLEYFLPENQNKQSTFSDHFARSRGLEFMEHEFYGFFGGFYDHHAPEARTMIAQLKRLAAGESLDDYMPIIKFLGQLESTGLWAHEGERGGCF